MKKNVEITVINGMEEIFNRYVYMVEDGISILVRRHARLLCVQLAARTQPFSVGEKGSSGKAVHASRERIDWDIKKIIRDNSQLLKIADSMKNPKLRERFQELIRRGDSTGVAKIMQDTGIAIGKGNHVNLLKGKGQFKSAHKRGRHPKSGRAYNRVHEFSIPAKQKDLSSYISQVQKRIGFAKAGWADCARKINILKGDNATGIPAWAKRKAHGQNGHVVDRSKDKANPEVEMTNQVSYVSRILPMGEIYNAEEYTMRQFLVALEKAFQAATKQNVDMDQPF
jgi:hypothetical protein